MQETPEREDRRQYRRAIAMLIGTIIGVGIFGVPYVAARAGIPVALVHFGVLSAAILLVHLFFGELVLRTSSHHRLVGYAGQYLGSWGKRIASLSTVAGMYGALLAYIIVSGAFLHQLLGPLFGGTPWLYSVASAGVGIVIVGFGLRMVQEFEFLLTALLFIAMAVVLIVGVQRVDVAHWSTFDLQSAFLPYGAILFSIGGASAIAELRDLLQNRERLLSRAIAWGTLIAIFLTIAFTLVVVGVSGSATTSESIAGLAPTLGRSIVILGAILGFLAIATSFLTLGLYLNQVFALDFQFPRIPALLASVGAPLLIFLLGNPDFTQVILITGAVFGGIDGILVAVLVLRARKFGDRVPEYVVRVPKVVNWIVVLLFVIGIGVTIVEVLGG